MISESGGRSGPSERGRGNTTDLEFGEGNSVEAGQLVWATPSTETREGCVRPGLDCLYLVAFRSQEGRPVMTGSDPYTRSVQPSHSRRHGGR